MGTDSGAVANRQLLILISFPADQRPNPVRFALLAPAGGGICSNSFIHSLHKNRGSGYYRLAKENSRAKFGEAANVDSAPGMGAIGLPSPLP